MGWQDAPVVGEETGQQPAWMGAPVVGGEADAPAPSYADVGINAIAKGAASIPDAVLNTPTNVLNLTKMGYGAAAGAMGRPDIPANIELSEPPNLVRRLLRNSTLAVDGKEVIGPLIRPEREPQTAGQRILDTAVQGGMGTAIAPGSRIGNALTGLVGGAAAQTTKELTGSDAAAIGVGLATPLAVRALTPKASPSTSVRNDTLKDAQAAGYVVPPSQVRPGFINNRLESVSGKAAVGQEAAVRNQGVTNTLAAKALGLPKDTPLTESVLETVREKAGKVYEKVANLPQNQSLIPTPRPAVDIIGELKEARYQANALYKHYDRSADPASLQQAQANYARAKKLERDLEQIAQRAGKPELIAQLREARKQIAKSYDVDRALNLGDANVSASIIGRILNSGKPLTGDLRTIGRFAEAFPSVAREGARIPSPGVSGTDAAASAMLGTVGYGAAGGPSGLLAAGLPLLRGPARSLVLSPYYQRMLAQPAMGPRPLGEAATQGLFLGRQVADR